MDSGQTELIDFPHNLQAERAVLASCMLDKSSALTAMSILKSDDFFHPPHRMIFDSIQELIRQNRSVDFLTLEDMLSGQGNLIACGGTEYIAALGSNAIPSMARTEQHAEIVLEKAQLRRLIIAGKELISLSTSAGQSSRNLLDLTMSKIIEVSHRTLRKAEIIDIENAIYKNEQYIADLEAGKVRPPVRLGYSKLDSLISLMGGNMLVIGGRPSHGKTAFAVGVSINLIFSGYKVLFISIEMDEREMTHRFVSAAADISITLLRSGSVKGYARHPDVQTLMQHKHLLRFVCPSRVTELDVARMLKYETLIHGKPDFLIIDYLQRMRSSGRSPDRRIQIGEIANHIKDMLAEFDIPGILLSQLTRPQGKDRTANKPPSLYDLKEAGEVENVADAVGLIHRLDNDKGIPIWDIDFLLEKNRNGPLGDIRFHFIRKRALFQEPVDNMPSRVYDND